MSGQVSMFRSAASSKTPAQHSVRSGLASKQRVVGSSPTGGAEWPSSWGDVELQQLFTGCLDDEELDVNPMARMRPLVVPGRRSPGGSAASRERQRSPPTARNSSHSLAR
jgi:hypothetical protein